MKTQGIILNCQYYVFLVKLNYHTYFLYTVVKYSINQATVEPLYCGHFGTLILVLITEVSSIQRSFSTPQYYTGTQNGVLIREVSAIQRFVIERFHCIHGPMTWKIFIPLSDEEYQINNSGDSLSASNRSQTVDCTHFPFRSSWKRTFYL